jgi:acyl carrier protein
MTTTSTRTQVVTEVLALMEELADDWEYSGPIGESTRLIGDLGLESLDLVVLGTAIQQRYGRLPFAEFLAEIGQRPVEARDVSVGELVGFISAHSKAPAAPSQR